MRSLSCLVAVALMVAAGCGSDPLAKRSSTGARTNEPSAIALASPTAAPTMSAAVAIATPLTVVTNEVRWDLLGDVPDISDEDGVGPFGAVGFERGYIVTGDWTRTAHYSADGVHWTTIDLRHPRGSPLDVFSVATDGRRVVAVGAYTPCSVSAWERDSFGRCRARPASWTTKDGVTWRSSAPWTGSIGPVGAAGSAFYHVWAVPHAGFEASQGFDTSDGTDPMPVDGPAIWHSEDGRTWSRLTVEATPDVGCGAADTFQALADGDGHRYAMESPDEESVMCEPLGEDEEDWEGTDEPHLATPAPSPPGPFIGVSTDGKRYDRVPSNASMDGLASTLAPISGRPWVSVGPDMVASTSEDFVTWTMTGLPLPIDAPTLDVLDVAHSTIGYVATGCVSEGNRCVTWLSEDGRSWRIADEALADGPSMMEQLVDGPAGTLGFGTRQAGGLERLAVWALRDGDT